jgi:hypothetical protein
MVGIAVDAPPGAAAAPGLKALAQARRFVGVAEQPPGSNRTPFGRWFGADGEPWCAMFLSYCFAVGAGIVLCGGVSAAGVNEHGCAYVPTLEQWLRETQQWVDTPRPGDIAVFNWDGGASDHAGIVERILVDGGFATIEGNAGDEVARRRRARGDAVGFGRVRAYVVAEPPSYT